ncbi:transmembrane amino acid transporter protein-domain-containing protein [Tricladium varicosporioides]|nr:transmembrane amino acid transporter protein-domain-containing protein [Hymenoscyphus varicosporioides]
MMSDQSPNKKGSDGFTITPVTDNSSEGSAKAGEVEVFSAGADGVEFRTVGWIRAAMFFTKMTFAAGVLSIPSALYTLGAVLGALFILFWGVLNTYMAFLQGQFKIIHPSVHTVADAAHIITLQFSNGNKKCGGFAREVTEFIYIITCIICAGVSTLGLSIAFNAVSKHATCSVIFGFVAYFIISSVASIRKIHQLGWITWLGFGSIVTAIMIVVIAATITDRPAAAPQTGDFELGFSARPPIGTTFAGAFAASLAIFSSSANTSGFVPVISEMRRPQDYFKSLYACMTWITSSYLALALAVYAYCGKWVASPALGSAGPTIMIISYAVAIPGLIAGAMICVHVAAKSLFVRILRNTPIISLPTRKLTGQFGLHAPMAQAFLAGFSQKLFRSSALS